jgi:hypothetical protein
LEQGKASFGAGEGTGLNRLKPHRRHYAVGPACQRPMPPLPRSLLSLSHTVADHWARRRPAPLVSHRTHVAHAPPPPIFVARPPLSEWPGAVTLMSCLPTQRRPPPHSPLLLLPPRGTEPTPTPPLPPLKREPPNTAALSSFSSLALLRPRPSMHASHPRRRPSRCGPLCIFDRCRRPPPPWHPSIRCHFSIWDHPHLYRPPPKLRELVRDAADPPYGENPLTRRRTEPPLRLVVAPPPR